MSSVSRPAGLWEHLANLTGLNKIFLRPGRIEVDPREDFLVSPVDAKVARVAPIGSDGGIQEKNLFGKPRFVRLAEHLGESAHLARFEGGQYVNLYLSPMSLHFILFPAPGKIVEAKYVPGACYPLVFCRTGDVKNEKLFAIIETPWGFPIAVILVGSFLVCGLHVEAELHRPYEKGQRLGCFKLGSTVVLVFPPDTVEIMLKEGQKVRPGEAIGRRLWKLNVES